MSLSTFSQALRHFLFGLLTVLLALPVRGSVCELTFQPQTAQDQSIHETGYELEIPLTSSSLGLSLLVEPTSSELEDILLVAPMPPQLAELKRLRPSLRWQDLTPEQRYPFLVGAMTSSEVLSSLSTESSTRTTLSRSLREFQLAKQLVINFKKPTRFFGNDYSAGTHTIALSDIFSVHVENTVVQRSRLKGFEFHLQSALPTPEVFASIQVLLNFLKIKTANLHAHVVGKAPFSRVTSMKDLMGALEVIRRFEFLGAITSLLHGYSSRPVTSCNIDSQGKEMMTCFFSQLPFNWFSTVQQYLLGDIADLPTRELKGFVGVHSGEKYGDPMLWGLEPRYGFHPKMWPEFAEHITLLQSILHGNEFGFVFNSVQTWASRFVSGDVTMAKDQESAAILEYFAFLEYMKGAQEELAEVWVHDAFFLAWVWTKDPMTSHLTEGKRDQLLATQQRYLKLAEANEYTDTANLTRRFLAESGLQKIILDSLTLRGFDLVK